MHPRLHVADSASAQHTAAKAVFEVATDMDNTSLRQPQSAGPHGGELGQNEGDSVNVEQLGLLCRRCCCGD